jgi:ligand-binding sensor protein
MREDIAMNMLDVAPMETWKQLEKEIGENFSINPGVYDTEHKRVTDGADWCNKLCPALRSSAKGIGAVCAVAGQNFAAALKKDLKPRADECDAGLVKVVVPVIKDGELVGAAGGCGCIAPEGEVDCFFLHKVMDVSEEEVGELAASVPVVTREDVDRLVAFVEKKVAEIVG